MARCDRSKYRPDNGKVDRRGIAVPDASLAGAEVRKLPAMSIEDAAELPGRASHGGELPAGLWAALTWLARREGFAVELASGCHGDSMTSLSTRRILVRYGLDRPDSARALLHELGHVLMSDAVAQQPGKSPAGCRGIRKLRPIP